jgi:hypothetical protein
LGVIADVPTMKMEISTVQQSLKVNEAKDRDALQKVEDVKLQILSEVTRKHDKFENKIEQLELRFGAVAQDMSAINATLKLHELMKQEKSEKGQ